MLRRKKALEVTPFIFKNSIVWAQLCSELFARYPKTTLPFFAPWNVIRKGGGATGAGVSTAPNPFIG